MNPIRKRILTLTVLCLLLLASAAAFLFAFNLCLYYGWVTATARGMNLARSQRLSTVWFWVSVGIGTVPCILIFWILAGLRKLRSLRQPGTCPACGYDRTASGDTCPECGSNNPPRP